ncbi:glycoside hydrolase family 31 protein [Pseudogracilibacillus sp. SE30717A]|uniref:discoidin domain-containing protein n=1 Tax=Pseudogracilibacillus sp. SE30717A TaxID=3098293 RepID=UPI00300E3207
MQNKNMLKQLAGLFFVVCILLVLVPSSMVGSAENNNEGAIGTINSINQDGSDVFIELSSGEGIKISFLKDNLFRFHLDPTGKFPEYPTPNNKDHVTTIVDKDENEYKDSYGKIDVKVEDSDADVYKISTNTIELRIDKKTSKMSLYNKKTSKVIWEEAEPLKIQNNNAIQTLTTKENEYFYGGGQQNGYYSHKNQSINIKVGGGWDAGAASSPVPFYLSTEGYGVMRNTFKPGMYDFSKTATFGHNENRFDAYYFVDESIPEIIDEYTELTGKAALMPEYAFYLGHLDCFNGVHNGHKEERNFMEDAYKYVKEHGNNDMPLGWFLPNDGYSCGYSGLDNLENFVNAAKEENVVTGLWTESNLHPDPNLPEDDPKRRDLDGEVKAGIRAIKTDVAWVGNGYSMALNATRLAAEGIEKVENSGGARPFVVTVNGWAGTQRYSTLWSGDQYGGNWEYIRMHIPTYIGAGLSGNPNIGSDMDGIFGGNNVIQTRDFQWKAFTPIQMDMSGWAGKANEKNPWNYGEPYASINRMYLKLKAEMMPYNYTIAEESTSTSMPMVRGMMLEYPEDPYTYGTETQYQFMWGPNLLIAPVYKGSDHDAGVRNGIYLPDENQIWIDYFTGEQYKGGSVINNFKAPLWKTPVFVKAGAIIPMAPENNSILELDGSENRIFDVYPLGKSEFTMYEDDGETIEYKNGKNMRTKITSEVENDIAVITVHETKGNGYNGMVKDRGTEFIVNTNQEPEALIVNVGTKKIELTEAKSIEEYEKSDNVYFYDEKPDLNKYATEGSEFEKTEIITTPKLYVKVEKADITANKVTLTVEGFSNASDEEVVDEEVPEVPKNLRADEEAIKDNEIKLIWDKVESDNVQYDIMIDGVIHRNIFVETKDKEEPFFVHTDLKSDTEYTYQVRAVNTKGASNWSEEVKVKTDLDRFRNVPKNMTATASSHQSGEEPDKAIDGKESTMWHTNWNNGNVPPHTFEIDMKLAYDLDKFEYVPRSGAGNGTILKYNLDVSLDGKTYKSIVKDGKFDRNDEIKTINFNEDVYARYIKITITDGVGGFGSAGEFRPYKKDKTEGWVVGKNISDGVDGKIGEDDLNFFASYMGVDETDTAWNQVKRADINYNGVIDAYDLMYVASHLGEEPLKETGKTIKGSIDIRPSKEQLTKGEEFTVDLIGNGMQDINAFSLELLADTNKYRLIKISTTETSGHMLDYSTRNGQRIMAAFSNKGTQKTLEGTEVLATITLEAREDTEFGLSISRSMLLNTSFETKEEIGKILAPNQEPEIPEEPRAEKILTNEDITITGDDEKMQGGKDAFEKLIDGNLNTLAELIWTTVPGEDVEGVSLPLNVQFTFNHPEELKMFEVYNRPTGQNGKIKKLSATAIDEENNEYDLGMKEIKPDAKSVVFETEGLEEIPKGTKFSQIHIVFEESHVGHPKMLSVAEIEFTAYVQEMEEVDKAALKAAIVDAEQINLEEYTEESVEKLMEKLDIAKAVANDQDARQEQVDSALAELLKAIEGLEKVEVKVSIEKIKTIVEEFEEAGEFKNQGVARSLIAQLDSAIKSEEKGQADKVVHHMEKFKELLEKRYENGHISKHAYEALLAESEVILEQWN